MKKKLNPIEANMLQCTVLMLIIGLLMVLALNETIIGTGVLIIAGIFFIIFIIILIRQGLDIVDKDTGEFITTTKNKKKQNKTPGEEKIAEAPEKAPEEAPENAEGAVTEAEPETEQENAENAAPEEEPEEEPEAEPGKNMD